jgi:hypothetical protein
MELEGLQVRDLEVQVELLGDRAFRPGCGRERGDLLQCDTGRSGTVLDHQPLARLRIGLAGGRRFVAGPVDVAEQLTVKLREPARIGGIQDYLAENWERTVIFACHAGTLPPKQAGQPRAGLVQVRRATLRNGDVEDPLGRPDLDRDVWAHASGWDERDFAQGWMAESDGPGEETGSEPTATPVSIGS